MIELLISPREKDIGGLTVRRLLPFVSRRMVGPFIFLDHMGPTTFQPGEGIEVRPHPHIHLATVTYLFEGKIWHRDSLGSNQVIEPGAINWMTAGRGIVHSERTVPAMKHQTWNINGIQCWVAVPENSEEIEPQFAHHPAASLPEFFVGNTKLKLLLGTAFNNESPVDVYSDMFYVDVQIPKGETLNLPLEKRESAVYVASGKVNLANTKVDAFSMVVLKNETSNSITALEDSRLLLLGGEPVGKRQMYWNFISSSPEKLEEAKVDWAKGPDAPGSRFPKVPGDDTEFIPLPAT